MLVTGNSNPTLAEDNVHKTKVVGKQKLNALAAITLSEALSNEINININQDAQLGSGISMRGIQGQQVKILMDGVPVIGRNNGMIDLSQINMNNVDRIEIIEGPMSIIYGSDASAGLINIISSQPEKGVKKLSLQQQVNSNGTFNSHISLSLANAKNQFNINGTRYLFQGFDENPDLRNPLWRPKRQYIGEAYFQRYFSKRFKQSIRAGYFNEYLISKGPKIIIPSFDSTGSFDAIGIDDYYTTQRINFSALSFYRSLNKKLNLSWSNAANYYNRTRLRKITDLEDLSQEMANLNATDTQTFNSFNSRLIGAYRFNKLFKLGFGYDINREEGNSNRLNEAKEISDYAVFYNLRFQYNKLTVEQGTRVTYNNQFNIPFIPALHVSYKLKNQLRFISSYAKGFRAPSIKEQFLYFVDQNHNVIGNPNLNPELSHSFNFSIQNKFEKNEHDINYQLNAYYTSIQDMIILASLNNTATEFQYDNIESFYSQGGNVSLNYGRKNFEINTAVGLVGTKQDSDSLIEQDKFLYRTDAQLNVSYYLEFLKTKLSILNKFNGRVPNYYRENSTLKLQYSTPYIMTDISAFRTFAVNKLSLGLSVKNIFNITSIQNTSNIGGVHSAGANSAAVGLGRYYSLNIRYNIISEK